MTDDAPATSTQSGDAGAPGVPGPAAPQQHEEVFPGLVRLLKKGENALYVLIAVTLLLCAFGLFVVAVGTLFTRRQPLGVLIAEGIGGVLIVVILLELFQTVITHFERGGLPLRPFLVIGVLSAVRHILVLGAKTLYAAGGGHSEDIWPTLAELGLNAVIVLILVGCLVWLKRAGEDGSVT